MIFGDLDHLELESKIYPAAILKALKYLKNTDFTKIENGTYEIDNQDIFAKIFEIETRKCTEQKPEAHEKYIDIQFSIEGNELIGFERNTGNQKIRENILEKDDNAFYEKGLENEIYLKMNKGNFAILFPNDIHRPGCSVKENKKIRKAVVKVAVKLLDN